MNHPQITPTQQQSKAISNIVQWYGQKNRQVFYMAGYAGVGKSTIAELAIKAIRKKHKKMKNVRTAAYTGKAASVLRRKGIDNAQTIHGLIYSPSIDKETREVRFSLNEFGGAAEADLILLDEISMVDEKTANDLKSFGKKILVMGDPGQLPPVKGAGAFTNQKPDVFLDEIHRQAADSPIIELATMARKGEPLTVGYKKGDVEVMKLTKQTADLIYREDTQVICGLNKVRWTITQRIRTHLGIKSREPQVGETIICCRNNHALGIFNGAIGTLLAVREEQHPTGRIYMMEVAIEGVDKTLKDIPVDPFHFENHFNNGTSQKRQILKKEDRLEEFDWGYALTAHKAQGTSWPHVTVIDDSRSFKENRNNWIYTSLTRAETGLTILLRD